MGSGLTAHMQNSLFGPTVSYRNHNRVTPFSHALFGVSHLDSDTAALIGSSGNDSFAMALGAGVDANLSRRLAVRLGQIDYVRTNFVNTTENNFRYSAGIVLKF